MTHLHVAATRALGWALLGSMIIAAGVWCAAALAIAGPHSDAMRRGLAAAAGAVALGTLIALALPRWRWRVLGVTV
ncbi:MAG TPA: hypothetical protein VLJ62_06715, partial [Burkholderiaceae bacterium]|nr:hypothetical protein [Burkholderiaceae bacterium]